MLESEKVFMKLIGREGNGKIAVWGIAVLLATFLLSACGNTTSSPPTPQSGTVGVSTSGTAPIVVLTETPSASGTPSQKFVTLADRALLLGQVSQKPGVDASSTGISVTLTIKNTSTAPIKNLATFYQLVGAEGDAFGTQSSVTPGFYGAIAPGQERSGTIVFEVPTGAIHGLRLLFRPEFATDTVLLPLHV